MNLTTISPICLKRKYKRVVVHNASQAPPSELQSACLNLLAAPYSTAIQLPFVNTPTTFLGLAVGRLSVVAPCSAALTPVSGVWRCDL